MPMENFKLGDRVKVLGKNVNGEVAFIGDTHFSGGEWLGIILDEPKGRHNGAMEGIRYFKCPRNYGVFVRACQLEKECVDTAEVNEKTNNSASSKITYPNYLKSNSKLKPEKQLCPSKNIDARKTKSHLKIAENSSTEIDHSSNSCNRCSELQATKQENGELKMKLKTVEKSLQEALNKYRRAIEEMTHVKEDLGNKKQQIKVQKYHLKFLKMRQCNHYKKIDSFKTSGEKMNEVSNDECLARQKSKVNDDSNFSEDELDIESMKALSSMQRIIELEEQNRIMIQGLVELKQFLKSKCQSQVMNINSNIQLRSGSKTKNRDPSVPDLSQSTAIVRSNGLSVDESESHIKEYTDMLREMTRFSEIMKERERFGKELETPNSTSMQPAGDCSLHKKDKIPIDSKVIEFRHHLLNQNGPETNTRECLEMSGIQIATDSIQNSLAANSCGFQNSFQIASDHNRENALNLTPKIKEKSYLNSIGDRLPSNASDSVKELRKLISSMALNTEETSQCNSNTSLIQQELLLEVLDSSDSSSLGKSETQSEFQIALPCHISDMAIKSSGDNGAVQLKGEKPKTRMLFSTRIYQRK